MSQMWCKLAMLSGQKKIIIIVSVLLVTVPIMVSAYWFYFRNPYTNIVVGEMQPTSVTINGVEYIFTKGGNDLAIYPWDESHYPKTGIFSVQEGESNIAIYKQMKVVYATMWNAVRTGQRHVDLKKETYELNELVQRQRNPWL